MSEPQAERQLAVQYAIARAFAEAERLEDIAGLVLQPLADTLGWETAAVWVRADDGLLRCVAIHSAGGRLDAWVSDAMERRFSPGEGLPGRVWVQDRPIWISDTDMETNFPRRDIARQVGLRHGFAFPVRLRDRTIGVVELFAAHSRELDQEQAAFLEAVGHQIGSFIERIEARRAVAISEARKAGILGAAVDAIVSADRDGRILEFNRAAEELLGRRRADVIGLRIADLLVPDDLRAAHEAGLARYMATGQPRILNQRVRTWAARADGSRLPVELTVTEVRLEGEPMFTAFLRDITVEREAEIARERFLEILSHELRTPVTAIYGGSKVLRRESLAGKAMPEVLDDISEEADRLYRLVEDLIVLARAERGALEISLEPVRIERIAERVIGSFRSAAPELQFELVVEGLAPPVIADETYVEQLLRNLLSNAVKYGAQGGVIEVHIVHQRAESTVSVLDRGVGIREDEARQLFEIDYRSPLTEGLVQGSGIGLFVARWLAEGMGGRIWARPRAGGGSEFGFALRVMDVEALGAEVARGAPPVLPLPAAIEAAESASDMP